MSPFMLFLRSTEAEATSENVEIFGIKTETTQEQSIDSFLKRHTFQWKERFGLLAENDPRYQMLDDIKSRLMEHSDIPSGNLTVIDSPEINAFVINTKTDVYVYTGLLRALSEWCERNKKKFTTDKIAFVIAHEMTHIEQGTFEETGESEEDKKTRQKNKESLQEIKNAEYDADRGGLILMAKAGFNAREGLEAIEFLQSLGEGIPIFSTHPRSSDRLRELLELVESPNTFLPNIETEPSEITGKLYDSIHDEPENKPGTKLYRKEGLHHLSEIMEKTDNFHDAMEITLLAIEYDTMALAFQEREKDYMKAEQAKRIVIENTSELIDGILFAYAKKRSGIYSSYNESGDISETTRYRDQEFIDSKMDIGENPPLIETAGKEKTTTKTSEAFNQLKKKFEKTLKQLQQSLTSVEKNIQKSVSSLDKSYYRFRESPEELAEEEKNLQTTIAKLKELESYLLHLTDDIQGEALDTLVENGRISDTEQGRWSEFSSSHEFIQNHSIEELISWCRQNGTIFFQNQENNSNSLRRTAEKSSGGLLRFESSYQAELPPEYKKEDLSTPEGKRRCVERHRLSTAQFGISDVRENSFKPLVQALQGGQEIPKIDGIDFPIPFSEKLREPLKKKFAKRYESCLPLEAAEKMASFVSEKLLFFTRDGYNPDELQSILNSFTISELETIIANFPLPSVTIDCSAGQKFQQETEVANKLKQGEFFYTLWENEFRNKARAKVQELGGNIPSPEKRLEQLIEMLEISPTDAIYLYQKEIIELIGQSQILNLQDLNKYVAPVINLVKDPYARRSFLEMIIENFDKKIPPQDLLHFLEGEEVNTIWEYFHTLKETNRWGSLSAQDQLSCLQVLFEIIPKWDKECLPDKKGLSYDETNKQAPLFAMNLSAEFIHLYQQVNPEASFVDALRSVHSNGFFGLVETEENRTAKVEPTQRTFLGDAKLHTHFESLSPEDLKELLLLLQKPKKRSSFRTESENNLVHSYIERALDQFDVSLFRDKTASEAERLNLFDQIIEFSTTFIPKEYRDSYLERYLKKFLQIEEYSLLLDSEVIPKLQSINREQLLHLFQPISEEAYNSQGIIDLIPLDGLDFAAEKYDPASPGLDTVLKRTPYHSYRQKYIDAHLHKYLDKRHILREPGLSPLQRLEAILKLIPERTDYKHSLFTKIEEGVLEEANLKTEGHRIVPTEGTVVTKDQAQTLYYFYLRAIPEIVNTGEQQLWSRRADQLFQDYLQEKTDTDFSSAFDRIKTLYPDASYARDEALMQLGDSPLVTTPAQAHRILEALFAVQRKSVTKKESQQQGYIEKINPIIDALSRKEKKDFLLWIIGATSQPPLTFRAFGGHNNCSVEEVPKLIFAVTEAERKELLIRLLSGTSGILNSEKGGEQVMESFLEEIFEKMFPPSESINAKIRDVLFTTFKSIMTHYNEFRKADILISMVEVLKGQNAEASLGERIHTLLGELGPVAIKVEQVLSEEEKAPGEYLLPEDIRTAMQKSKQDAKTFHRTATFQVLESAGEFAQDNPNRIVSLEKQLAAASIKQVSLARRADGTMVVEKIRRPSIGKHLEEDLRVLQSILKDLSPLAEIPEGLGERIARWLEEEANFEKEVESHLMLQRALEHYPNSRFINFMPIRTAEIYASSKERIQEEWVQGLSLGELMALAEDPSQIEKLAKKHNLNDAEQKIFLELTTKLEDIKLQAFDVMMYLMFKRGEFHSDLHGGNILITPKGELTLIDAGSTGKIEPTKLIALKKFFTGFLFNNPEFVEEGVRTFVPTVADTQIHGVMDIIQDARMEPKEKFKQILQRISENKTHIDPGFEKFIKGLATGSYLSRGIDPVKLAGPIMTHASPF